MPQKIYALLVGINDYPGSNQLNGCVHDANAIEKYVKENYTAENGFEVKMEKLLNSDATRDGIINVFRDLFGKAKDGDVCLFYYSGHGDHFSTPEEIYSQDTCCQTLVCYINKKRADIADKELGALIYEVTKGKEIHFVAITDCCHSGSNTRDFVKARSFENKSSEGKFCHIDVGNYVGIDHAEQVDGKYRFPQAPHVHIASCRDDQKSIEKRIGQVTRGVFTYSLLDILTQKEGYISYESLTEQVKFAIKKHTNTQEPCFNKNAGETLLGQRQFLNSSKIITGNEPVIYHVNGSWHLNKGSLHGVVKGDAIRLKENGLENSCDAKVKIEDMDHAELEINNSKLKTNDNKNRNSLPVTIDFSNKEVIALVVHNSAEDFKTALLQSPQLQKLEFVNITEGEPDAYYIGYDKDEKKLYLTNVGFDEPVVCSNRNTSSASEIDLFLDNIDKYIRAKYFAHFTGKPNAGLSGQFDIKFFLQQDNMGFKEIKNPGSPIKIEIKNALENAAKVKLQVINKGRDTLFIRSAYTDAFYGIQTDLHHELELQPGDTKYLEVKDALSNRDITELFFNEELLEHGITCMREQLKLFVADTTFGINGFTQEGISLNNCRPNGSKGNTFKSGRYNWVVENFNFEVKAV